VLKARYRRIVYFFARLLVSFILWDVLLPSLGLRGWSQLSRSMRLSQAAARFRSLAVHLGGVMIKVGQFFSARVDVLPAEITQELAGLQDEVPAEGFSDIRRVIEAEFSQPLEAKFPIFEHTPEAAASLGQVHRAKIAGQNVVVKVQRPNIEQIIATDLAALRTVGKWLQRYRPISRRADIPAILAEFTRILYEEIDYLAEGKNAETFAANLSDRPGVRVPGVVWTHTTRRVLTLEDVGAIKITDYAAISAAGITGVEVAERLFKIYLQQIFEDGFFHADPHPGNLFVSPLSSPSEGKEDGQGEDWQLVFVDFGMVGHVPPNLRTGMREMAIAVGTRDASRMVKSFQLLGVLLPGADLSLIEKAEAMAFDRFWGKSMTELTNISRQEMHEFAAQFQELIFAMPFQVPQDLILLGRTVGILSGMCTGLDPDFNLWEGLAPFAQKLIAEEAAADWKVWLEELGKFIRPWLSFPQRMDVLLGRLERGDLVVQAPQLSSEVNRIGRSIDRLSGGLVFAVLLLGGIQLYLAGEVTFGVGLIVAAAATLVWMILTRR